MSETLDTAGRLIEALSAVHSLADDCGDALAKVDVTVTIGRSGDIYVDVVGDAPLEAREAAVNRLAASVGAPAASQVAGMLYVSHGRWRFATSATRTCPTCGGAR